MARRLHRWRLSKFTRPNHTPTSVLFIKRRSFIAFESDEGDASDRWLQTGRGGTQWTAACHGQSVFMSERPWHCWKTSLAHSLRSQCNLECVNIERQAGGRADPPTDQQTGADWAADIWLACAKVNGQGMLFPLGQILIYPLEKAKRPWISCIILLWCNSNSKPWILESAHWLEDQSTFYKNEWRRRKLRTCFKKTRRAAHKRMAW